MRHSNLLSPGATALVVVDLQEAFRNVIGGFAQAAARTATMVRGAVLLDVPIVVTEQYPKGLGRTAEEVLAALPPTPAIIEKTAFSSCGAAAFLDRLQRIRVKHVMVCGLEAHICVNQSVHDLLGLGYQVHLLHDCLLSRNPTDREVGLAKMLRGGALPSSVEMALFELMGDAKHEQFRAVQKLIK